MRLPGAAQRQRVDDARDRALRTQAIDGRIDGRRRAPIDRLVGAAHAVDGDIGCLKERSQLGGDARAVVGDDDPTAGHEAETVDGQGGINRLEKPALGELVRLAVATGRAARRKRRSGREESPGSGRAVRLFGEGGHPVDDHAEGACTGQRVHRLSGIRQGLERREFVAHLAEDLDSLDGIDPQVGFHVEVEPQGFDGIAGAIANGLEQTRGDCVPCSDRRRLRGVACGSCGFPLDAACECLGGRRRGQIRAEPGDRFPCVVLEKIWLGRDGLLRCHGGDGLRVNRDSIARFRFEARGPKEKLRRHLVPER